MLLLLLATGCTRHALQFFGSFWKVIILTFSDMFLYRDSDVAAESYCFVVLFRDVIVHCAWCQLITWSEYCWSVKILVTHRDGSSVAHGSLVRVEGPGSVSGACHRLALPQALPLPFSSTLWSTRVFSPRCWLKRNSCIRKYPLFSVHPLIYSLPYYYVDEKFTYTSQRINIDGSRRGFITKRFFGYEVVHMQKFSPPRRE